MNTGGVSVKKLLSFVLQMYEYFFIEGGHILNVNIKITFNAFLMVNK